MNKLRLSAAALLLTSLGLIGWSTSASADSVVTITQADAKVQPADCLNEGLARLGLSYTTSNTAEAFTLRIVSAQRFCSPLTVKAAVYEMPGSGVAWPQTLVEAVPFTIQKAGVTEVRFAKTCLPTQFDVLTGATPETISPTGPFHGPLLFPFATATAHQHMTNGCQPTTTTTTEPSTTSTTSTTPETSTTSTTLAPTTTQPYVAPSSTVPVPSTTTSTVPAETSSTSVIREPAELAYTGGFNLGVFLTGVALLALGGFLVFAGRRRTA